MNLAEQVIRMGKTIREQQNIRLRQPLKSITINHPDQEVRVLVSQERERILEELNIKNLILDARPLGIKLRANYTKLGPRFKRRVRDISKEIEKISAKEWASQNSFEVLGEIILKEEITVDSAHNEFNSLTEGDLTVILDFGLDSGLLREGMAREVRAALADYLMALGVKDSVEIQWFTPYVDLSEAILSNQYDLEEEFSAAFSHEFSKFSHELELDTCSGERSLMIKIKKPATAGS